MKIGVSGRWYQDIEAYGRKFNPTIGLIFKICDALQLPPNELFATPRTDEIRAAAKEFAGRTPRRP